MTRCCGGEDLLTWTDVDIPVTLSACAGFSLSDVASVSATLTLSRDPTITITPDVIMELTGWRLVIGNTMVTIPGSYQVGMRYTDIHGKIRGLSVSPEVVRFAS